MVTDSYMHADARREWVAHRAARCPTCHLAVEVGDDGALVSHYRYVDESNSNQPHDLIQCEGERTP